MSRSLIVKISLGALAATAFALLVGCASHATKAADKKPVPAAPVFTIAPPPPPVENLPPVMLGIDVLEADSFKAIAGKKIGLLTHPAGINRRGESTINVLRRSPQSKLVSLFAPEHGFDGQISASVNFGHSVHQPTGLPIYSLHGDTKKPTPTMLKGLDAVVIDLQDIGVRSYTFASAMIYTMAACFENNVEVILLDRPNPLGGLKVDGPPLDPQYKSYVGVLRVPYVHGLTIGELAQLAKASVGGIDIPKGLRVSEATLTKGRLTVIPMRGWSRAMLWPATRLKWVPTSPMIPNYEAVVGYAMVGLGCQNSGWSSGIGRDYPFRGISFKGKKPEEVIAAMSAHKIPGVAFVKREGRDRDGKPAVGVYVEVIDWAAWNPTEVSFYMQKQAARWTTMNPFSVLSGTEQRTFNIHVGSEAWFKDLQLQGGKVNVDLHIKNWTTRAKVYQDTSRKYWLYP